VFRKMPIILIAIIFFLIIANQFIPTQIQSVLYALSLTIISLLVSILPIIIFILLFKTAANLAKHATMLIFLIFVGVCISNFIGTMLSFNVGKLIYHLDLQLQLPESVEPLIPTWSFSFPKLISNDKAMFAGLIIGILSAVFKPVFTLKIANYLDRIVDKIFLVIVCVMPLFITGFVIKLIHDKIIFMIISQYAVIFFSIAIAQFSYICLLYLIYSKFRFSVFITCLKNMSPAAIAGLGTMSSAASMPLTLIGTEKNSQHPSLVRAIIPTTVNIHLIGDCFAIPIFAFAVLKTFGLPDPTFLQYLVFALYFVLAKFSAAGVPAGGIMVMLPVLAAHLGFNSEMTTLITALYVLFDPIFTCANIMGNGAFALLIANLYTRLKKPS